MDVSKLWATGITLMTPDTRRWTKERIKNNDSVENKIVFENFNYRDEGRSRKRICVCDDHETAALICSIHNNNDKLVEALKDVLAAYVSALKLIAEASGMVYSENNFVISTKELINSLNQQ